MPPPHSFIYSVHLAYHSVSSVKFAKFTLRLELSGRDVMQISLQNFQDRLCPQRINSNAPLQLLAGV